MEAQSFIVDALILVITIVFPLVGGFLAKFINAKAKIAKYGFDNDRVERIIGNAVDYSEQIAIEYVKDSKQKLPGNRKLEKAIDYIRKEDPKIISKYGDKLKNMVKRKVGQKYGINLNLGGN